MKLALALLLAAVVGALAVVGFQWAVAMLHERREHRNAVQLSNRQVDEMLSDIRPLTDSRKPD